MEHIEHQSTNQQADLSINEQRTQSAAIPIIEEQLQVGKQVVETAKVRLSKQVHEEQVTVDVPLLEEHYDVERVSVNRYLDAPPASVRYEGETMIIPILREEVVVEKRLVLVEELRLTKRQVETHAAQQVTLRKEEVVVERIPYESQAPNQANPDVV